MGFDTAACALAILTASVGFGSFLFHTLVNRWSLIADVVPIAVVIFSFFFAALTRFLALGLVSAGISTAALLILSPTLEILMIPLLGSSASCAPGLIATFAWRPRSLSLRSWSHAAPACRGGDHLRHGRSNTRWGDVRLVSILPSRNPRDCREDRVSPVGWASEGRAAT